MVHLLNRGLRIGRRSLGSWSGSRGGLVVGVGFVFGVVDGGEW